MKEMEQKMSEFVKLGKYKGLTIQRPEAIVSEEEKQEAYRRRQRMFAESVDVERPIQAGDVATIDFTGYHLNGEAFEGGAGTDYPLEIGSGTFIPGFEDQLIGVEKGAEVDVNVSFPEEYAVDELAGKPVVFKVLVKAVSEQRYPDLGATAKKEIDDSLQMYKNREVEQDYENMLTDAVVADSEVNIPEEILERELTEVLNQWKSTMQLQGLDPEQYYSMTNMNDDLMREQLREQAVIRSESRMVLEAIAEEENLQATKAAIEMYLHQMATEYGLPLEQVEETLQKDHMDAIESDVRIRKALQLIKENVVSAE